MVALDLDDVIFNGATTPAFILEGLREATQGVGVHPKAIDESNSFALTPFSLTTQAHDAVAWRGYTTLLALAPRDGILTRRAYSAAVGRIDQGGIARHRN